MKCSHCHLEYEQSALFKKTINSKDEYFCCRGCEGVFRLLLECNLGDFYNKLGTTTLSPAKLPESSDLARFDSESYAKKYIKVLGQKSQKNSQDSRLNRESHESDSRLNHESREGDLCEVSLIITGIHCIACVWLNQKILNATNGILKVDINFTNNKAKIIFNRAIIPLSAIIAKIRAIGYDAIGYDPKMLENTNAKERKSYYTRLVVGVFCTMNIMWIAVAQYSGYFLGMEQDIKDILNLAGFALCTPTLFYSGFIFFKSGYFGLKNGFINMDLLVATGASLAYFYSIYASLTRSGETYFESVTMIITFVLMGKFLEIITKKSAGDAIDNLALSVPSIVNIIENGALRTLSPQEVKIGDTIMVRSGEKIAIDGILLSQSAIIDSSMLTGESALESKSQNAMLISGSINLENTIYYRATRIFEDSTLNNIINLIQDSLSKKPHIETKANAISYHFSAFVLCCAVATFAFWWAWQDFEKAMIVAVSVVIIACPCALALATPIATIVGISEAYKRKLLFKEARFLESFAKSDCIIFDKTGTLTHGKPKVVGEKKMCEYDKAILGAFVALNTHPISKGIIEYLRETKNFLTPPPSPLPQGEGEKLESVGRCPNPHLLLQSKSKQKNIDCGDSCKSQSMGVKGATPPCSKLPSTRMGLFTSPSQREGVRGRVNPQNSKDSRESQNFFAYFFSKKVSGGWGNAPHTESSPSPQGRGLGGGLESKDSHKSNTNPQISHFRQIPQKGIIAKCGDLELLGGNKNFLAESGVKINECQNDSHTKFYYAINGELVAIFSLQDTLKNSAREVISAFQTRGLKVAILSGDRREVVEIVAQSLNITDFYAEQSPIDKSNFIDKLHVQGHKIVMVGDGINDAIALNKSDIAISMGAGSDIAIESSDIVLLDDSLESLLNAHKIALKTYATIKQNIKISIIYNLLTIPLAMCGFIIPLFAALSMSFSSILVVLNSMRIRRSD